MSLQIDEDPADPYRPLAVVGGEHRATHCVNCSHVKTVGGSEVNRNPKEYIDTDYWYCYAPTGKIDPLSGMSEVIYADCRKRFEEEFKDNVCPDYEEYIPPEPESESETDIAQIDEIAALTKRHNARIFTTRLLWFSVGSLLTNLLYLLF